MDEESTTPSRLSMIALTRKNYRDWLAELKAIAVKAEVWQYVDPDGDEEVPAQERYPRFSDYTKETQQVIRAPDIREGEEAGQLRETTVQCKTFVDLSLDDKDDYRVSMEAFKIQREDARVVKLGIQRVHTAIMESARPYIPTTKKTASEREIVKFLQDKYQRAERELIEQIHIKMGELKAHAPAKGKVENWVMEWENLREEMKAFNVSGSFSKILMISDFLKTGKKWAPNWCENWMDIIDGAGKEYNFLETTKKYRLAVEIHAQNTANSNRQSQANAATLQGQPQANQRQAGGDSTAAAGGSKKEKKMVDRDSKEEQRKMFKGRQCICGEIQIFQDCPYLSKTAQPTGWKPDTKKRNEIRQALSKKPFIYRAIAKFCDTGILDGIIVEQPSEQPKNNNQPEHTAYEFAAHVTSNTGYEFANVATSVALSPTTPRQHEFPAYTYASDTLCKYANMAMPLIA